jgi:hypothetical protein
MALLPGYGFTLAGSAQMVFADDASWSGAAGVHES